MGRDHGSREAHSSKTLTTREGIFLSLDPGLTTGWASWSSWRARGYEVGEVHRNDLWDFLDSFHDEYGEIVIVYETFSQRDNVSDDALVAPKVIGVIEEWSRQNDVELQPQTPPSMYYFTEDKLIERDLFDGKQKHAMAALKHLMFYRRDYI